jgi:hypothetical protein
MKTSACPTCILRSAVCFSLRFVRSLSWQMIVFLNQKETAQNSVFSPAVMDIEDRSVAVPAGALARAVEPDTVGTRRCSSWIGHACRSRVLRKMPVFTEFSLRSSQACLGNRSIFYRGKWCQTRHMCLVQTASSHHIVPLAAPSLGLPAEIQPPSFGETRRFAKTGSGQTKQKKNDGRMKDDILFAPSKSSRMIGHSLGCIQSLSSTGDQANACSHFLPDARKYHQLVD